MRSFRSNAFHGNVLSVEEEDTSGQLKAEIEYMFYARIDSPSFLMKAESMEIQEQWGLWQDKTEKNAGCGSNRIRKTITKQIIRGQFDNLNTTTQIVHTTKLKRSDGSSLEVSVESSEDALTAFKVMTESGMIKHRYRFPVNGVEGMFWEVDMFVEPGHSMFDTKYLPYAKIDLEVPSKDYPIPNMPDGFLDAFNSKVENPTEEQQKIIDLMKEFISLPNPYIKETYTDVIKK